MEVNFTKSKSSLVLPILAFVMVINALSYGVIIPLLYPYALRFGIDPFGLSLLFMSFSLAQFVTTPLIGRLSDKFGRRPLLVLSILGTGISLALFASARSVAMLFISRIIDGVTAGNMPVAQAIIADKIKGPERAKAFGLLGASFGVGFLVGPAIGGLLSSYSITAPFWFASGLSILAAVLAWAFIDETLPAGTKLHKAQKEPLIDFKKLVNALFTPLVGAVLLIVLITSLAQNMFFIGFQTHTNDVLKLTPRDIGLLFAGAGLVSVLMQAGGMRFLLSGKIAKRKVVLGSLLLAAITMAPLGFLSTALPFAAIMLLCMAAFAPIYPVLSAVLSARTNPEDQGGIMGLNQSYVSLGQIVGPVVAGIIATKFVPGVFMFGSFMLLLAAGIMHWVFLRPQAKVDL